MRVIVGGLIVMALWVRLAAAEPPQGSDPNSAFGQWYRSLMTPDGRMSCCGVADCRHYPVRVSPAGYAIHYEGEWIDVPDESIDRTRFDNPTGDYVACVIQNRFPIYVVCFFLRPGT